MVAREFQLIIIALGFVFLSGSAFSQCEIMHRIYPDGSMLYFIEPVNFYWTQSKSLKGGVVTDKENYYLALQPVPFPEKETGRKLKSDLTLKLADDKEYKFEHFDTRYMEQDSVMELLYLVNKPDLEPLQTYEVIHAKIDMMGDEGLRTYTFKLHKSALKEQLGCFMQEGEEKKDK